MIAQERDRVREKAWHTRSLRSPHNSWGRGRATHWHTDTVTPTTMLLLRQLITARISVREREPLTAPTAHFRSSALLTHYVVSVVLLLLRWHTGTRRAGASVPIFALAAAAAVGCRRCCRLLSGVASASASAGVAASLPLLLLLARSLGRSVGPLGSEFTVKLSTCAHQGSDKCIGGRELRRVRNFYALNSRFSGFF